MFDYKALECGYCICVPNFFWYSAYTCIHVCPCLCVHVQFRTRNRYSPWFTPDPTALDQHKNILWRTALASNSPRDMQIFREVRNQCTQAVWKAKASFFKQKFASYSTNSKRFCDSVKSLENKCTSSQLPTALRLGNTVTTDKSMKLRISLSIFQWLAMLSTWLPLHRSTALHPPQQLAQASPISPSPAKSGPLQVSRARQSGPTLSKNIRQKCCNPYY